MTRRPPRSALLPCTTLFRSSNPSKANGSSCDLDNDLCTLDTCDAGACTAGSSVTCTASDQCHDAGECSPTTGLCSNPAKANGSSCDLDNDLCTLDTCDAGACTAGSSVTCTASDQCHDAGECSPTTGLCSNPAKANGSSCDLDNDLCTLDTCDAGACTAGSAVACTASDQCHDAGECSSITGPSSTAVNAHAPPGDLPIYLCTLDTCDAGACTAGSSVTCTASDQCHDAGECSPTTG